MRPVEFKEQNVVFAKDQPEYLPLPAYRTEDGHVYSCWRMSAFERFVALFTGRVWFATMTFNQPLQPHNLFVKNPFSS